MAGHGDRAAKGNLFPMTQISIYIGHLFFVDNIFLHCAEAPASERVPTHSPAKDPKSGKSPKWPHRSGKEPRDPFQP